MRASSAGVPIACHVPFEKVATISPLLPVGLNLLLVIPEVLVTNTPLWIIYPYCYSGYLVSYSLHEFTTEAADTAFHLFPFLPCAVLIFALVLTVAVTQFGKKEMR
mgnify:CR=1 FL=1